MARIDANLTAQQRSLLAQYWWFYSALDDSRKEPTTEAQRKFVSMCHGKREPETEHELAYLAGRRLVRNSVLSMDEILRRGFCVSPRDMKDCLALPGQFKYKVGRRRARKDNGEGTPSTTRPTQYHAVDVNRFGSKRRWVPMHNW